MPWSGARPEEGALIDFGPSCPVLAAHQAPRPSATTVGGTLEVALFRPRWYLRQQQLDQTAVVVTGPAAAHGASTIIPSSCPG